MMSNKRSRESVLAEVLLILAWAVLVGRQYLDFSPQVWPYGGDYPLQVQAYYVWEQFRECGGCVFWNGTLSGGVPAFADFFGGVLHPLLALGAILWGAINGSKVVLVASFAMAGIAQWWLARVMGLGLVARLWVALIAVTGGHMMARMDMGLIVMVLSIAAASLVLAPALDFALTGRRSAALWLGITAALAFLSGQGYMQLGLLFAVFPAYLLLLLSQRRPRQFWIYLILAGGIALLLSAVNWLPMAHFWPNIGKPGDPYFNGAQPVSYIPFNLLIYDYQFYTTEVLSKKPIAAFYMNYIGWLPLIFTLGVFRWAGKNTRSWRILLFFLAAIGLVFWASSGQLFRWLVPDIGFLGGARHPALISTLAVPLILGLSAWGLDLFLRASWPKITDRLALFHPRLPYVAAIALGLVLFFSLRSVYVLGKRWGLMAPLVERYQAAQAIAERLTSTQWVGYPFGDLAFIPAALDYGLKVSVDEGHRSWNWRGRLEPPAAIAASQDAAATSSPGYLTSISGYVYLVQNLDNQYAYIQTESARIPCLAEARGGNIQVACSASAVGQLVVMENMWPGWRSYRDDQRIELLDDRWLRVEAPAGEHVYQFRYRPVDAILGVVLSMLGLLGAVYFLWRSRTEPCLEGSLSVGQELFIADTESSEAETAPLPQADRLEHCEGLPPQPEPAEPALSQPEQAAPAPSQERAQEAPVAVVEQSKPVKPAITRIRRSSDQTVSVEIIVDIPLGTTVRIEAACEAVESQLETDTPFKEGKKND